MQVNFDHASHNNKFRQIAKLADENHININDTTIRMFYSNYKVLNIILLILKNCINCFRSHSMAKDLMKLLRLILCLNLKMMSINVFIYYI